MADRFQFSGVRQKIIEMIKTDLLGPMDENEVLQQNPRFDHFNDLLTHARKLKSICHRCLLLEF